MKQAIHNEVTATAIAAPRMRLGKISEITTHITGASDMRVAADGGQHQQQHRPGRGRAAQ